MISTRLGRKTVTSARKAVLREARKGGVGMDVIKGRLPLLEQFVHHKGNRSVTCDITGCPEVVQCDI